MNTWTVPDYARDWAVPGYTEERELGRGDTGRVVEAVDQATGRQAAIKYLSPALIDDPVFMQRLSAVLRKLEKLSVPQVAAVYDFAEEPGQGAAIVTELIDGVSLRVLLARRGPLSREAALAVLKGSLLGLAAVHRLGFGHRDYKPGNVLVDTAGGIKLTDFGVALPVGEQVPAAGTALYLAPERWQGAPVSPGTDIYAATAVFFECLTSLVPFPGDLAQLQAQHASAAVPLAGIDGPLQQLVARGLAKNAADRPQSAIAFVSELEALAANAYGSDWEAHGAEQLGAGVSALLPGGTGAGAPGGAAPWFGPGGGRWRTAALAAVAVVLLGGAATAVTLRASSHQGGLSGAAPQLATAVTPLFTAVARVTPPVAESTCTAPTAFTFSGTVSATAPGTVDYRWVYSSGKPGPVRTVQFRVAGQQTVTGDTVKAEKPGSGWAQIKLVSPVNPASDTASYRLLCGGAGPISTSAASPPAAATSLLPSATASGTGVLPSRAVASSSPSGTASGQPAPWSVEAAALSPGSVGVPYSATFAATDADAVSWTAGGLPPGLTLDPDTGTISGTPASAGSYQVSVTATDTTTGTTESAAADLEISAATAPVSPSAQPTQSPRPTQSAEPTQSPEPTRPGRPTRPTQPAQPTPAQSAAPTQPSRPPGPPHR
jgi:serine/threonine-protein kinase